MQNCTYTQARNQRGRKGGEAPPRKMCWTYFKTGGHGFKNLGPSQKTLRYP